MKPWIDEILGCGVMFYCFGCEGRLWNWVDEALSWWCGSLGDLSLPL